MTTFRLVLVQEEYGCGYTIGCGTKVVDLAARTLDAAEAEARSIVADDYDERRVAHAWIATARVTAPVATWRSEAASARHAAEKAAAEDRERAELARLRAKYEGR
jgi:hypothetical protein